MRNHDVLSDPEYSHGGTGSIHTAPLTRPDVPGRRVAGRDRDLPAEVRPFTEDRIALMETFADQAAIAIENVRLFNETKEALERQTATTACPEVISSSPTNVQPIFEAVAGGPRSSAVPLPSVLIADNDVLRIRARVGRGRRSPSYRFVGRWSTAAPSSSACGARRGYRATARCRIPRCARESAPERLPYNLAVPMTTKATIGTIGIWRDEVKRSRPLQIGLLRRDLCRRPSYGENVRLSSQTKEALERQPATAEF